MKLFFKKISEIWYNLWGYIFLFPNYILYKIYKPKTLIILGMHRSGTSCITRMFNLNGVYLGHSLLAPKDDNPKGFWENTHIFKINEKILKQSGGSWYNPPDKIKVTFFDKLAMMNVLYNRKNKILGIKDPRLLITWEAWKPFIEQYTIIGVFRHPLSVAKSLQKRNQFDVLKSIDLWKKYNNKLISVKKHEDIKLIDFDNPDSFKEKISMTLKQLDLDFDENSLNFYNPKNRSSDYINSIEDSKIFKLYSLLKS